MRAHICWIVLAIGCLQSCMSILGYRQVKEMNKQDVIAFAKKMNVPDSLSYIADTSYLKTLKQSDKTTQNTLLQPLQIIVYQKDSIYCHIINCHVGGFPYLKWKRTKSLDSFPISQGLTRPTIGTITKQIMERSISPLHNKFENKQNKNYSIFFLYSRVSYRNTKKFIKIAKTYIKQYPSSANYYFVNTDMALNDY